jgi:hypothetical protein
MEPENKPELFISTAPNTPEPEKPPAHRPNGLLLIIIALLVIGISVATGWFAAYKYYLRTPVATPQTPPQKACTMEAKLCPDGSSVGRSGPNCEFAPCPAASISLDNWKTFTSNEYGMSFQYPPEANFYESSSGTGPSNIFKVTYMGTKQKASGRTQTDLADGYILTVSVNAKSAGISVQSLAQQRYAGAKENCQQDATFTKITPGTLGSSAASTYTVTNCLGDYTEYFVENAKYIFEITQIYTGAPEDVPMYKQTSGQIASTFKMVSVTPDTSVKTTYVPQATWQKATNTPLGIALCLPPKWEMGTTGDLIFNRDPGYKPTITTIQSIPYTGGSTRQAYINFWKSEYPDPGSLVSITDTDINGNKALTIAPKNSDEAKSSPEGLAVVWFAKGKLWKAGLSAWQMVESSQSQFLRDFYTTISCSF